MLCEPSRGGNLHRPMIAQFQCDMGVVSEQGSTSLECQKKTNKKNTTISLKIRKKLHVQVQCNLRNANWIQIRLKAVPGQFRTEHLFVYPISSSLVESRPFQMQFPPPPSPPSHFPAIFQPIEKRLNPSSNDKLGAKFRFSLFGFFGGQPVASAG